MSRNLYRVSARAIVQSALLGLNIIVLAAAIFLNNYDLLAALSIILSLSWIAMHDMGGMNTQYPELKHKEYEH